MLNCGNCQNGACFARPQHALQTISAEYVVCVGVSLLLTHTHNAAQEQVYSFWYSIA
jgi:hypothetical protein